MGGSAAIGAMALVAGTMAYSLNNMPKARAASETSFLD
jgi:hypothetical protein